MVLRADDNDPAVFDIDTWVMSCRVFARRLEHAMLELIRDYAARNGTRRVRAPFKLSAKNSVAQECLVDLGFADDGAGNYIVPLEATEPPLPHYIKIERA